MVQEITLVKALGEFEENKKRLETSTPYTPQENGNIDRVWGNSYSNGSLQDF